MGIFTRLGLIFGIIITLGLLSPPLAAESQLPGQISSHVKRAAHSGRHILVDRSGLHLGRILDRLFSSDSGSDNDSRSTEHPFQPSIWTQPHSGAVGLQTAISF